MHRIMRRLIQSSLAMAGIMLAMATLAANDSSIKINWGYKGNNGPSRWAQLDHAFILCAAGKAQAPIDIPKKVTKADYLLKTSYHDAALDMLADGSTDLTIGSMQAIINDGHSLQLNFNQDATQSVTFEGKKYNLIQFHFHSPSENEWHGRNFPLEIQFVHQNENGKVLVLAVFVVGGAANPALEKIIEHIPPDQGKEYVIPGEKINPADLLPENKNYFSFTGSLTAPPCIEGVQWIVMEKPISASPAQILTLRKAIGGANARSVQPLHHREVYYSAESSA